MFYSSKYEHFDISVKPDIHKYWKRMVKIDWDGDRDREKEWKAKVNNVK